METVKILFTVAVVTFVLTAIFTKRLIPFLKKKKMGQKILEIGPGWHKKKEGTPTMGGLGFVLAISISFIFYSIFFARNTEIKTFLTIINVYIYGILNCLVGVIDDIAKYKKNQNLGLTPKGKLLLQSIFTVAFLWLQTSFVGVSTVIEIPFTRHEIEFGPLYYVLMFLILCGITNAVNLTDGLDGLASTCVMTVGAFLSICGVVLTENNGLSFFGGCLLGATLGFLVYNLHPAKVFMGDTGSLFLGAVVASSSFLFENPIVVMMYGFVFVFEAITVVMQVLFFKITRGKRLFKMAPFHHHLEKSGFSEMKIVVIFGVLSMLFCITAGWSII